jgi:23S rRNA (adenine2503-C2)-methyltransferase
LPAAGAYISYETMTREKEYIPTEKPKTDLKDLSRLELGAFIQELGWKPYRADQIFAWIFRRGAVDIGEMTDLAKTRREQIGRSARISALILRREAVSRADGTIKCLFGLEDGQLIESVLIREGGRRTVCVSTQVGCGLHCAYCATGDLGLKRNLRAAEIVDQVITMRRMLPAGEDITNVVLMGMGEPLRNYRQTVKACRLINDPDGLAIGARRITLSTAGVVPGIDKLAGENMRLGLAISLNATTDKVRNQLIPLNRKYPVEQLLGAADRYARATRRPVTFEYVLLAGVNDAPEDALRLAERIRNIRCKINLIPYNQVPGKPFRRSSREVAARFQELLYPRCPAVTLRESKGADIQAACGQLRGEERLEI